MDKLRLPVIKNIPSSRKRLSMDAYLEFVAFNLEQSMTGRIRKALTKQKRLQVVQVPFRIK